MSKSNSYPQDLCEVDATEADAQVDDAAIRFPSWKQSSEQRREHFRAKAREHIASGRFVSGRGWADKG